MFVERIIRVAVSLEGVERIAIVWIQRQPEPDALWQVGIRDEVPSEGNQVRIPVSNSSFSGITLKTSRRNDLSRENLSQPRGRNGPLTLGDQDVPFDTWFDDVQVRESKAI